jgi:hypothetical protein
MAVTAETTQDWTVRLTTDVPGPGTWTRVVGDGVEVVVGETQTAEDRFAPLGVPLRYLWTTQAGVEAADPVTVESEYPVLSSAYRAGAGWQVVVVAQQPVSWEGRSIAHDVLSRRDPLVTVQQPRYHSATLRLHAADRYATDDLLVLLVTGEPLILRSPCPAAVRDATILPGRWTEDLVSAAKPSGQRWIDIDYQAVSSEPMAWQQPAEWTWEVLEAVPALGSYADLQAEYANWAAVARGR